MTEETTNRKARVRRLKRILVGTFLFLLILPTVLCILSFARIHSLEKKIDALTVELEELTRPGRLSEDGLRPDRTGSEDSAAVAAEGNLPEQDGSGEAGGPDAGDPFGEAEPDGARNPGGDDGQAGDATASEALNGTGQTDDGIRRVYLTFDDGPSIYTDDILDILAEYDVKATFFVVGKTDETSLAAYKRIVEEGHTLGMHSYSHKYNEIYASEEAFAEDFQKLRSFLEETTGVSPVFYRFPGGSSNTVSSKDMSVFARYLKEQGVTYFDWNISSGDATGGGLSASSIRRNAVNGVANKNTAVILLHDAADKYSTVRALPDIIQDLQAMEDTEILPITEDTVPIQHVTFEE